MLEAVYSYKRGRNVYTIIILLVSEDIAKRSSSSTLRHYMLFSRRQRGFQTIPMFIHDRRWLLLVLQPRRFNMYTKWLLLGCRRGTLPRRLHGFQFCCSFMCAKVHRTLPLGTLRALQLRRPRNVSIDVVLCHRKFAQLLRQHLHLVIFWQPCAAKCDADSHSCGKLGCLLHI